MDVEVPSPETQRMFNSLIEWMKSVKSASPEKWEPAALRNCRLFAEVLQVIDPSFFNESFVEKIQEFEPGSNWRLKGNNLRKVLRMIHQYYEETVHRDVTSFEHWKIEDMEFAASDDLVPLVRVMNLVVGAAFLGPTNEVFISEVPNFSRSVQEDVAAAVMAVKENSLETKTSVHDSTLESQLDTSLLGGGDETHHNADDPLHGENERLKNENSALVAERERLEHELSNARQEVRHLNEGEERKQLEREISDLRERNTRVETHLMETEAERDALRNNIDMLREERGQLEVAANSVNRIREENQRLLDENEALRVQESENAKLQATIEQMKQKIKESNGLVSENKVLSERLESYLKVAVDCDDLRSKNEVLRRQMASYKIEIETKEKEARELTLKVDKLDFELAKTQERVNMLEGEKKRLLAEKAAKEDFLPPESLQMALSHSLSLEASMANAEKNNGNPVEATVDTMEKVSRLQIENARLREKAKEAEDVEMLRQELESLKAKKHEVEAEVRLLNKRNMELQAKLDTIELSMGSESSADKDTTALKVAAERAAIDAEQWKAKALRAEATLATAQERDSSSQGAYIKENEFLKKELETERCRLRDYLEKARQVIVDQEARSATFAEAGLSRHEFDELRREIEQKEKRIRQLEAQTERTNTMHEQEQRVMTTAWYQMAQNVTMYQRAADSGSDTAREKSFLAKQRQGAALSVSPRTIFALTVLLVCLLTVLVLNRPIVPADNVFDRSYVMLPVHSIRSFSSETRRTFLKAAAAPVQPEARSPAPGAAGPAPASAVLIPLVKTKKYGDAFLFTKRSSLLRAHRGEICFPGGRIDEGESTLQTALRETEEEIGLLASQVDVWGEGRPILNRQLTTSVVPVIGEVREESLGELKVNFHEVDSVFAIPLDKLIPSREYTHFVEKNFHYVLPLFRSDHYITYATSPNAISPSAYRVWGLSAIMLHHVLKMLYPDLYNNRLEFKRMRSVKG